MSCSKRPPWLLVRHQRHCFNVIPVLFAECDAIVAIESKLLYSQSKQHESAVSGKGFDCAPSIALRYVSYLGLGKHATTVRAVGDSPSGHEAKLASTELEAQSSDCTKDPRLNGSSGSSH